MSKRGAPSSQVDFINVLKQVDGDPSTFNALIHAWNSVFELNGNEDRRTLSDVEKVAFTSMDSSRTTLPSSAVGRHVGHLLETFSSPAFLVRENGCVLAQNAMAIQTYGIEADGSLDNLPFDLEKGERVSEVVRATLSPSRNLHDAVLKRAYSTDDDSAVTLSIAPSKPIDNGKGEALVFVVGARWKTAASGLIKREFDLTQAERELLESFLDGQTTQDMAVSRNRSHSTVRTQFQSLMSKMGARSQTELFRNALSVSQFIDKVDEIAEVLRHPYRKRVDLVRPGGRSVEITMSGDLSGRPVVFLQTGAAYTYEQHIEQAFFDAGICMLSICRPGFGDTDPALPGDCALDTFAQDLSGLLDQLGHKTCILMGSNTSSGYMYRIAPYVVDRVSGLFQISAAVPTPYYKDDKKAVPWIKAMHRAATTYPNLAAFIVKAGVRAWAKMGQEKYFSSQMVDKPEVLKTLLEPGPLGEAQRALDVATKQGFAGLAGDVTLTFSDFTSDVAATNLPILSIHGTADVTFSINAARAFAADFKDRVTFVEMPEIGHAPMNTHAEKVLGLLNDFIDEVQG